MKGNNFRVEVNLQHPSYFFYISLNNRWIKFHRVKIFDSKILFSMIKIILSTRVRWTWSRTKWTPVSMSTPRSWTWHGHEVFGKTWRGHGHGHEKIRETWRGHGHGHEKSVKRGMDMDMVTLNLRNVAWTWTWT